MPRPSSAALVLGVGLALAAASLGGATGNGAVTREPGRPALRVFTERNGLPQSSVGAMAIAADGYLWACTREGLARFDGSRWQPMAPPDHERPSWPRAIAATADGALWIGTDEGGLRRWSPGGTWLELGAAAELPSRRVQALAIDGTASTPVIWVGTEHGLARVADGRLSAVTDPAAPSGEILALSTTPTAGELWVGTDGDGLFRLRDGTWSRLELPDNRAQCLCQPTPGSDTVLVGTAAGLFVVDPETLQARPFDPGLGSLKIRTLLATTTAGGEREIWIGTEGAGLIRRRGLREWRLSTADGLPSDFVLSLAAGGPGEVPSAIFVGTLTGFATFDVDSWLTVDRRSGLPDDTVVSILDAAEGVGGEQLWFGTLNGGLAGFDDGRWSVFGAASGLASPSAFSLAAEPDGGALWVGTNDGLARFDGRSWRHFGVADGLPHPVVVSVLPVDDGALWIGTYGGGAARLQGRRWETSDVGAGELANDTIEALLEVPHHDGDGAAIWIGTNGGLSRFDGGGWRTWTVADGLPNDVVRGLHLSTWADGSRTLWVGTGAGLAWGDPDELSEPMRWTALTTGTEPALPNGVVYRIEEDRSGRLYLTTNRGVVRLTPISRPPRTAADLTLESFGSGDGLHSVPCRTGIAGGLAAVSDRRA